MNRLKCRQILIPHNIIVSVVLILSFQILTIAISVNLLCNSTIVAESKEAGHLSEVQECDCRDADWVHGLARRIEAYYEEF